MRLIIEKRPEYSRSIAFLVPVASVLLALLAGAVLLALVGANPLATYKAMASGAFGGKYNVS